MGLQILQQCALLHFNMGVQSLCSVRLALALLAPIRSGMSLAQYSHLSL